MGNDRKPTNPYAPYRANGKTQQGQTVSRSATSPSGGQRQAMPRAPYYSHSRNAEDKKRKRTRTILVSTTIVLLIVLIALIGGYIWLESLFKEGDSGNLTDEIIATAEEFKGDVVNILVCGVDYDAEDDGRDYGEGKGMTDVIMYVNFDVKTKKVNILQLPRDSYVGSGRTDSKTGKINAIYAGGENQKDLISNLAKVINEQYQLPIDYYMTIDMAAFKELYYRLNTALGGIEMHIPWDVEFYDEKTGETMVVEKGNTIMDADTVEWVLRQRKGYAQGDIKRLELQQYFYAAMFRSFKQLGLTDLVYFVEPFTFFVRTDMNAATAVSLGLSLLKVDNADITIYRSPGGPITVNGQSCYGVNPVNMAEMLNKYFRTYGEQVPSLDNLPIDFEYHNGEIYDEGKNMAAVSAESETPQ